MTDEMDAEDKAWLATMVPEGCVPLGFLAGVVYLDDDGAQCWKVYNQLDSPLTGHLGLLELMKLEMLARTPGNPLSRGDDE